MMKKILNLYFIILVFFPAIVMAQKKQSNEVVITGKYVIPKCPSWVNNAVFYQVYPQSFYDSDGDGIGDLKGIIDKLDYIKSLGVDAIWINPFFESPFCDGGYDISDYFKVAPRYGRNADAKRLFEEAHKLGLKVIFDYVVSYTSIDNPWFQQSAKQEHNKYSNWYIWTNNVWKSPPGAFKDAFIKGYGQRNGQYMQNFFYCEPALNFGFAKPTQSWMLPPNAPDVLALRKELKKVLRFWMNMGADGFRADMAGALVKNANITGNDQYYSSRDSATLEFWQEIRHIFDTEYPNAFMISEWSDPKEALDHAFDADFFHWYPGFNDLMQKESWRILNGYSHGHSFFDKEGKGNIMNFLNNYMDQYTATKSEGYISLPLGNHDLARLNIRRTPKELAMIFAFDLTMPGLPFIYYGNEIGMRQLYNLPYVEGAYKPRAGDRTPMQWTSGKNRGFSTAPSDELYLPVDTTADAPNVASEEADPNSLLNHVKALIALKKSEPALTAYAEFVPVYAKANTYPFIYARANGNDVVLAIFNPADRPVSASFALNLVAKGFKLLAGDKMDLNNKGHNYSVNVPPIGYAIYKLKL